MVLQDGRDPKLPWRYQTIVGGTLWFLLEAVSFTDASAA